MKKVHVGGKYGGFALVDDNVFGLVNKFTWYGHQSRPGGTVYAASRTGGKMVKMHRIIFGEDAKQIDHIDGNGLNNQRCNLREATHFTNRANQGLSSRNTSGFKGIYWNKKLRKWAAKIVVSGKQIHLGICISKEAAAIAWNRAAIKYHGEFARPNKI